MQNSFGIFLKMYEKTQQTKQLKYLFSDNHLVKNTKNYFSTVDLNLFRSMHPFHQMQECHSPSFQDFLIQKLHSK